MSEVFPSLFNLLHMMAMSAKPNKISLVQNPPTRQYQIYTEKQHLLMTFESFPGWYKEFKEHFSDA